MFGDKATNHLIARWSRYLPLELRTSAAGYGLVFIAPLGDQSIGAVPALTSHSE